MHDNHESYPEVSRKRHAFARIFLEITLVMIFVMIMTYSPGKHNDRDNLLQVSSQSQGKGQGLPELDFTDYPQELVSGGWWQLSGDGIHGLEEAVPCS